jgi:hypothetical protein
MEINSIIRMYIMAPEMATKMFTRLFHPIAIFTAYLDVTLYHHCEPDDCFVRGKKSTVTVEDVD